MTRVAGRSLSSGSGAVQRKRSHALFRWIAGGAAVVLAGAAAWVLAQPERWDGWRTFWVGPDRERFPVHGIDVSHHQGPIDWARVKASGQAFAFIKATEGADFRDTRFGDNWRRARAEGLITGAYHYFTFCSPGVAQAENFLAVAPRERPVLPLAVDVEFTGNCVGWESVAQIRDELLAFMEHVRAHVGAAPLLYTTEEVRLELVPPELREHSYWVRSLWGEPSATIDWHFWQYSDTGSVPGIRGEVDLNVFSGAPGVWQSLLDAARAP
ncbi:MAG TPA: GH25 family lysozyme [Polyangiaceae bacterium]|nr:GH25 family lysozyme [Polyangiaceae bacterium]